MLKPYIAGLVTADGNLSSKESSVSIYTNSPKFARTIKSILREITGRKAEIYQSKGALKVFVFDKHLHSMLNQKYGIPIGKKSSIIAFPHNLSKKSAIEFIRGYVDGDGSIYVDKRRRRNKIQYYPRVEIASKNKRFLKTMRNYLEKLGITCGRITEGRRTFRFRIYSSNVKNFVGKIGFRHPDKFLLFPKPQAVDATV